MARLTGEGFRKSGFWAQIVLLFFIDWATINAFGRETVPWYHYVGFVLVNVVLISLTVVVWRWLREKRSLSPDQYSSR